MSYILVINPYLNELMSRRWFFSRKKLSEEIGNIDSRSAAPVGESWHNIWTKRFRISKLGSYLTFCSLFGRNWSIRCWVRATSKMECVWENVCIFNAVHSTSLMFSRFFSRDTPKGLSVTWWQGETYEGQNLKVNQIKFV